MIIGGQLERVNKHHTRLLVTLDGQTTSIFTSTSLGGSKINLPSDLGHRSADYKFFAVNLRSKFGNLAVETLSGEFEWPELEQDITPDHHGNGKRVIQDSRFEHADETQAQLLVVLTKQLRSVSTKVTSRSRISNRDMCMNNVLINNHEQYLIVRLKCSVDGELFVEVKFSQFLWPGPERVLSYSLLSQVLPESPLAIAQLTELNLSCYTIESIAKGTFFGLDSLKTLALYGNAISGVALNGGLFKELIRLEKLVLSFNQLAGFDKSAFAGLANLHYLDVSNNQLDRLNANVFSELLALQTLRLDCCRLTTRVHADAFVGLTSLKRLYLNNCCLRGELDPDVFRDLVSLKKLELKENRRLSSRVSASLFRGLKPDCLIIQ
jgi:Leucine-rich repeat (LRR) protein